MADAGEYEDFGTTNQTNLANLCFFRQALLEKVTGDKCGERAINKEVIPIDQSACG
jgi:hypothetical protein